MRASSQAALDRARERWEPVLRQAGERARTLGEQLFGVVDVLDSSVALRRALTEPSRAGEDKAGLTRDVFTGKADAEVVDLLAGLVRERWSEPRDLADASRSWLPTRCWLPPSRPAGSSRSRRRPTASSGSWRSSASCGWR
ncbi:hypothetical protein [Georgenia sp. SUBG003]|uniref:hypothetical protein n=1 Tax=Georgenia sp. SUBG003 TaxID=1497974 RepID=UPI003AB5C462